MKNILLSTVALLGFTAGAMAADLPRRAAPVAPMPVAAVPVFTWTGFYVGVNGGYAFGDERNNRRSPFFRVRDNGDGSALGGAQIGYNMQFGMFVAGIEADAQAIDLDAVYGSDVRLRGVARALRGNDGNDGVDGFGTVRGRLGMAFDRAMIYATGGLAWRTDEDNNTRLGRLGNAFRNNDDNIGFTVGGGVEYAFTNNLSAKVEGLYVDFSENNDTRRARGLFGRGAPNLGAGEFGLVRAGLNYRFGTW